MRASLGSFDMPRTFLTILALSTASLIGCDDPAEPTWLSDTTSFEETLEPWIPVAIDTGETGGAHAPWSIERTQAESSDGSWSVKLTSNNLTDAVKLWIERPYSIDEDAPQTFDVTISFDFGTSDFGSINLWKLVVGAFGEPPRSAEALEPAFRGETGAGEMGDGVRWLLKKYTSRVTAHNGEVYVVIGVWGTFETIRTYYIDNVRVTFTPVD
jgi:hypothetical protein